MDAVGPYILKCNDDMICALICVTLVDPDMSKVEKKMTSKVFKKVSIRMSGIVCIIEGVSVT